MVTEFSTCTNRISTQDIAGHVLHNSMSPYSFKSWRALTFCLTQSLCTCNLSGFSGYSWHAWVLI